MLQILILIHGNIRGLPLLLLLGSDVSINAGPVKLGVLNATSIRNKGPHLAGIVTSQDFDSLCHTKTHVRLSNTDGFLQSVTLPDFVFCQRPCPSGISGSVVFVILTT